MNEPQEQPLEIEAVAAPQEQPPETKAAVAPLERDSYMSLLLLVGCLLYGISWTLPALDWGSGVSYPVWTGSQCFLSGLMGFMVGHFEVLANFGFIGSVITAVCKRWTESTILGLFALICGAETFLLLWFPVPLDEGGAKHLLHTLDIGFFCWIGGMFVLSIYSGTKFAAALKLNSQST